MELSIFLGKSLAYMGSLVSEIGKLSAALFI